MFDIRGKYTQTITTTSVVSAATIVPTPEGFVPIEDSLEGGTYEPPAVSSPSSPSGGSPSSTPGGSPSSTPGGSPSSTPGGAQQSSTPVERDLRKGTRHRMHGTKGHAVDVVCYEWVDRCAHTVTTVSTTTVAPSTISTVSGLQQTASPNVRKANCVLSPSGVHDQDGDKHHIHLDWLCSLRNQQLCKPVQRQHN